MRRSIRDPLPRLLESFFHEYLDGVRGASRHTVVAYRDAIRLFLCFVADSSDRQVSDLCLDDLTADRVLAFLDHLENHRGNSIATRNSRFTALRSLLRHAIRRDPSRADQYQQVLSIPMKRGRRPRVTYLEPEEVQVLLRQPDRRTQLGIRDFALILFLYNTGARIGEALHVRVGDLKLHRPRQVRLLGKGRKERLCLLWCETASALRRLITLQAHLSDDARVFRSRRGESLSHDGAAYIIARHFEIAAVQQPSLRRKHVTPHVLRHSCAVALLQAGMDLTVIRDYLGHASIATTNRYVSANVDMKRRTLDVFWKHAGLSRSTGGAWKPTPDLLAFLASL